MRTLATQAAGLDQQLCLAPGRKAIALRLKKLAGFTRMLQISGGYEGGNDVDRLRRDPVLKLGCGRCPRSLSEYR